MNKCRGSLPQAEFYKGLAAIGVTASRLEMKQLFDDIDTGGKGFIDQRSLQIAIHRAQRECSLLSPKAACGNVGKQSGQATRSWGAAKHS